MELPLAEPGRNVASATREAAAELLKRAVELGLDFKLQEDVYRCRMAPKEARDLLVTELPERPSSPEAVLQEFVTMLLPLCKNEASPHFLGFSDTGDDVAALAGGVLSLFAQQNLINQSFDSPECDVRGDHRAEVAS